MLPPSLGLYLARKPLNLRPTIPIRCAVSAVVPMQSPKPKPKLFDLKTYWATLIAEINQKLDKAILVQLSEQMYKAMRYFGLGEGAKHMPPMICITPYKLFDDNCLAAFPSAFVIVTVLVGIVDKFWI